MGCSLSCMRLQPCIRGVQPPTWAWLQPRVPLPLQACGVRPLSSGAMRIHMGWPLASVCWVTRWASSRLSAVVHFC